MKRILIFIYISLIAANVMAVPGLGKLARETAEALAKVGGKKGAKELAEYGGEKAIKETLEKVAKESGEATARRMASYADEFGLGAFKALARNPEVLVKALDDVPTGLRKNAVLAMERNTDEVIEATAKFGSNALEIAARQPGVGTSTLMKLGDDVVPVAKVMDERQFMELTQYSDEIAALPSTGKKRLMEVLLENPKSIYALTIGTGGAITIVKDGKTIIIEGLETVTGTDSETSTDDEGNKKTTRTSGFEKVVDNLTSEILKYWPVLILIALIGFGFKAAPGIIKACKKPKA